MKKVNAKTSDEFVSSTGAASSRCPDFSQLPLEGMIVAAETYEFGALKYGRNNWRKGSGDKDYTIERLNHVIKHAKLLQQQLEFGELPGDEDTMRRNAGAIIWGGMAAAESLKWMKR